MERRTRYIAIILIAAFIVAYESVAVEGALNTANLDLFLVASIPMLIGGLIIISLNPLKTISAARGYSKGQWWLLLGATIAAAFGALLWYDAVGLIGASKEAILGGGSSEVLFVVFLSAIFLKERLRRWEFVGGFMILAGVFLVLVRQDALELKFGVGELEAIVSSFLLASSAVITAKLLRDADVLPITGLSLLMGGLFLLCMCLLLFQITWPDLIGWGILAALGFFPAAAIVAYCISLKGLGASLTSVLFALNGILTVVAQLSILVFIPAAALILPENMLLAILGGIIAFIGVYLIHTNPGGTESKGISQGQDN